MVGVLWALHSTRCACTVHRRVSVYARLAGASWKAGKHPGRDRTRWACAVCSSGVQKDRNVDFDELPVNTCPTQLHYFTKCWWWLGCQTSYRSFSNEVEWMSRRWHCCVAGRRLTHSHTGIEPVRVPDDASWCNCYMYVLSGFGANRLNWDSWDTYLKKKRTGWLKETKVVHPLTLNCWTPAVC